MHPPLFRPHPDCSDVSQSWLFTFHFFTIHFFSWLNSLWLVIQSIISVSQPSFCFSLWLIQWFVQISGKWVGKCNEIKYEMDYCFRQEKNQTRIKNLEKARAKNERFVALLAEDKAGREALEAKKIRESGGTTTTNWAVSASILTVDSPVLYFLTCMYAVLYIVIEHCSTRLSLAFLLLWKCKCDRQLILQWVL